MIKNVKSLLPKYPNISFDNAVTQQVYAIDSVNLIVGESGSGKTELMRDIIHQLCGDAAAHNFEIDGDVSDLGVIYYSANPFREEMFFKIKRGAQFFDVSAKSFNHPLQKPKADGAGNSALRHQLHAIETAVMILSEDVSNFLVFIDNADMLLDMSQQRSYISTIDEMLANVKTVRPAKSMQLIVSSNSPMIASDVFSSSITRLPFSPDDIGDGSKRVVGFTGPFQSIVNYTFQIPSQGLVAQRTVERLQDKNVHFIDRSKLISELSDDWTRSFLSRHADAN